ncbi:MAG: EamA family transporter [Verrucomicrobiota bacterium]|nr:EamA family transporter [Verrucomicrobiota bacterium]
MTSLRRWFLNPWVQLAICVLLATAAEIFLKRGAEEVADPNDPWSWTGLPGLRSGWVWWGILVSVISLFNWLATIRKLPLTIAFPIGNAVHILVPLSSWIFLGEAILPRRWLGIGLVLVGLLIVAKPAARLEEKL